MELDILKTIEIETGFELLSLPNSPVTKGRFFKFIKMAHGRGDGCFACGLHPNRFAILKPDPQRMDKALFALAFEDDHETRLFNVDHIIPRMLGGKDAPDNYRLACVACNLARAADISMDKAFVESNRHLINPKVLATRLQRNISYLNWASNAEPTAIIRMFDRRFKPFSDAGVPIPYEQFTPRIRKLLLERKLNSLRHE